MGDDRARVVSHKQIENIVRRVKATMPVVIALHAVAQIECEFTCGRDEQERSKYCRLVGIASNQPCRYERSLVLRPGVGHAYNIMSRTTPDLPLRPASTPICHFLLYPFNRKSCKSLSLLDKL